MRASVIWEEEKQKKESYITERREEQDLCIHVCVCVCKLTKKNNKTKLSEYTTESENRKYTFNMECEVEK